MIALTYRPHRSLRTRASTRKSLRCPLGGNGALGNSQSATVIHLLESRGARVYSVAEDLRQFDAYSFWRRSKPFVFLNNMKSPERSRMDAAHELGHLVLHARGGARGREAEHQAATFASAFLMPKGSILAEAPANGTLQQLVKAKRRWNVSVSALVYRMNRVGILTEWRYRMLFVEMAKNGYLKNEPNSAPSESSQVLTKVFDALRHKNLTPQGVAEQLLLTADELRSLVLGLLLMQLPGRGGPASSPR